MLSTYNGVCVIVMQTWIIELRACILVWNVIQMNDPTDVCSSRGLIRNFHFQLISSGIIGLGCRWAELLGFAATVRQPFPSNLNFLRKISVKESNTSFPVHESIYKIEWLLDSMVYFKPTRIRYSNEYILPPSPSNFPSSYPVSTKNGQKGDSAETLVCIASQPNSAQVKFGRSHINSNCAKRFAYSNAYMLKNIQKFSNHFAWMDTD